MKKLLLMTLFSMMLLVQTSLATEDDAGEKQEIGIEDEEIQESEAKSEESSDGEEDAKPEEK